MSQYQIGRCNCDPHIEYCDICFPKHQRILNPELNKSIVHASYELFHALEFLIAIVKTEGHISKSVTATLNKAKGLGLHKRKKPLTEDEIMSLALEYDLDASWNKALFNFVRAVEKAHGINK